MLAQSRAFFSLPLEAKRSVLANKLNRGYTPFEEEVGTNRSQPPSPLDL